MNDLETLHTDPAVAPANAEVPTIELVTPDASAKAIKGGCFPVACDPCWPDTDCDPTDRVTQ